jgi:penicillin-binding protein-related factor A (putative recombinase)
VTEPQLVLKQRKAMEARGACMVKVHGGQYNRRGTSDLLGVYRGVPIAIETKLPGKIKNLTDLQKKFLREWKAAGGIAIVATSVKECMDLLDKIDKVRDGK